MKQCNYYLIIFIEVVGHSFGVVEVLFTGFVNLSGVSFSGYDFGFLS